MNPYERRIEERVQDAFEMLAPGFRLNPATTPHPQVELFPHTPGAAFMPFDSYLEKPLRFYVLDSHDPDGLPLRVPLNTEIGEEVAHYLHAKANPRLFHDLGADMRRLLMGTASKQDRQQYITASALAETVAYLGAIIYANNRDEKGVRIVSDHQQWHTPQGVCNMTNASFIGQHKARMLHEANVHNVLPRLARARSWDDAMRICENAMQRTAPQAVNIPQPKPHIVSDSRVSRTFLKKHLDEAYEYLAPLFDCEADEKEKPALKFWRGESGYQPLKNVIRLDSALNTADAPSVQRELMRAIATSMACMFHSKINSIVQSELDALYLQRLEACEKQGLSPNADNVYNTPKILRYSNLDMLVRTMAGLSYLGHVSGEHHGELDIAETQPVHPYMDTGMNVALNLYKKTGDTLLNKLAYAPNWEAAERIYTPYYKYRPDFDKIASEM